MLSEGPNSYSCQAGDFVYIWGAQLEEGPYPTSYIPTNGAPVTRYGDSDITTPVGLEMGQEAGTLEARYTYLFTRDSSNADVASFAGDLGAIWTLGAGLSPETPTAGKDTRSASSTWTTSSGLRNDVATDGANSGRAYAYADRYPITFLRVGYGISSIAGHRFYGRVRHVSAYPHALSAKDLEALTLPEADV